MTDIGPKRMLSYWKMGSYKGPLTHLSGERAIVSYEEATDKWAHVQFDNESTGFSFGWWRFPKADFALGSVDNPRTVDRRTPPS